MQKNAIILLGSLLLLGCREDMQPFEKGNPNAARRVLIAGTTSEFRQSIVTKVIEKIGTQDCYFKITDLTSLDEEDTEQYDAILLVTALMASRIDGRITDFLQKNPANPKVIVFVTVGGDPETTKVDIEVDAVTSASQSDRLEERADQLVILFKKRF